MSTPIQRLMQMLPQVEQIRNQRRGLDQDQERIGLEKTRMDQIEKTSEIQRKLLQANSVMDLVKQAGEFPETQREIVSKNYADLTGFVPPDVLAQMMGAAPESSRITGDRRAAGDYKIYEKIRPRIEEGLASIPDANIRDIALNSISRAFAGMDAGSARTASTTADRGAVTDPQMGQAVRQQLQLVMTPEELKTFQQNAERISQGWTGLKDARDNNAMQFAMQSNELMYRTSVAKGALSPDVMSPLKAIDNIKAFTDALNDKSQSDVSRGMIAAAMRASLIDLYKNHEAAGDTQGMANIQQLLDMDISKVGPASYTERIKRGLSGSKTPEIKGGKISPPGGIVKP